jgi:hypothetical protein
VPLVIGGNPLWKTARPQAGGREFDRAGRSHGNRCQGWEIMRPPDTLENLREMTITSNAKLEVSREIPRLRCDAGKSSQTNACDEIDRPEWRQTVRQIGTWETRSQSRSTRERVLMPEIIGANQVMRKGGARPK